MTSKRSLLWDYTNTIHHPTVLSQIPFSSPSHPSNPITSLSNWNVWAPPELANRVPFRPTVRGLAQLTDEKEWALVRDGDAEVVYFFNEPERAEISPGVAGRWWEERMVGLREGREGKRRKLVSPACASDENGSKWLAEWMEIVEGMGKGMGPDYMGVHYYGTRAEEAIEYLEMMHKTYPSHPLIVSEIACISRSLPEVYTFTARVANWIDNCPWIFEYAFFGCMAEMPDEFVSPAARLMDKEGNLTELMKRLMGEVPVREEVGDGV